MKVPDWFSQWLESQFLLQQDAYGVTPWKEGPEYVHAMITGLFTEVGELAAEIDWKYWSEGQGACNREQVIGEAVDALHFLGNILLWANVSGEELTAAYITKMKINLERQQNGYNALADKCSCTRELSPEGLCSVCD